MFGIIGGQILTNSEEYNRAHPLVYVAEAQVIEPREVLIEIQIDWTEERIIKEIENTFPDAPIMIKVAKCESHYKNDAYNPTNNSHDRGIFQLSQKYHGEEMEELGLDPHDIQDNIKFARILYDRNGLTPWSASKGCWNK